VEFFGTGEGPGGGAGGVGTEAGGVSFITHIADEEVLFGVLEMKGGFEGAKLHHAGAEAVAEENDTGVFFKRKGGGGRSEDAKGSDA